MPLRDVIGHTKIVDLLKQSVARGRVPQSLIFAGPEGVGKRAVALALAQAINCPTQKDGDACGRCNTCRRIAAGTYPDVVWLDKGGEASIKIGPLRSKVLDLVGYRPFEGARRVFVIEPADDLYSQEPLLKTLEEPPPASVLILITAYPDTLLATIQSRCRRVRFGLLSETDVARVLTAVDPKMDAVVARSRASAAGGSVARALSFEQREFEGDRAAAFELLAAAQRDNVMGRLKAATTFATVDGKKRRAREAASTRLAILSSLLRDLALQGGRQPAEAFANVDLANDLQRMRSVFDARRLVAAFEAVREAETFIVERNASPKIVADWLAVRM